MYYKAEDTGSFGAERPQGAGPSSQAREEVTGAKPDAEQPPAAPGEGTHLLLTCRLLWSMLQESIGDLRGTNTEADTSRSCSWRETAGPRLTPTLRGGGGLLLSTARGECSATACRQRELAEGGKELNMLAGGLRVLH